MNKPTAPPTLEDRIRTALANPIGSETLIELIREVEAAVSTADQTAVEQHKLALDLVLSPDPKVAHTASVEAEMLRDRLSVARKPLRDKLTTALAEDRHARWLADFKKVEAERDKAVSLFQEYRQHAEAIARMFATAEQIDKEVSRINGSAPDGEHRRLQPVELTARGLERFTRDNPSLTTTAELRDWGNSGRKIWPQHSSGSFAAEFAQGMTTAHPGARWGEPDIQAQRRAEAERENARMAAYHDQAAKDEEERINRQERELFAERRRGL
jgi:hypothetical protein